MMMMMMTMMMMMMPMMGGETKYADDDADVCDVDGCGDGNLDDANDVNNHYDDAGRDCDSCGVDGGNKYDGGYVGGDAGSAEDGGHGDDSDGSCDDDDDDTKDENNECFDVYNRGASFT